VALPNWGRSLRPRNVFSDKPAESRPGYQWRGGSIGGACRLPARHFPQYSGHYYAAFPNDPFGDKLDGYGARRTR
jgi:hypothetical protein